MKMMLRVFGLYSFLAVFCAAKVAAHCSNKTTRNVSLRLAGEYENPATGQLYFQVSIQEKSFIKNVGYHICGGVIIRRDIILAPAICLFHPTIIRDTIVDRTYLSKFSVVAGISDTSKIPPSAQIIGIKKITRLSPPAQHVKHYTVALAILSRNLRMNSHVRPISVGNNILPSWSAIIGWRKLNNGAKRIQMSQVGIRQINRLDCQKHVEEVYKISTDNEVVCKRPYETTVPLCYGDLGTIVMQVRNNRTFSLVGMNLWGSYLCNETKSTQNFLFETTIRYSIWIQEMLEILKKKH